MKRRVIPAKFSLPILRQLCNLIPTHLVPKLARDHAVDERTRTYSAWSHVVTMLFAHLTHAIGLNDVCDSLQMHAGPLSAVRGATPPTRNNLSHANKVRDCAMAEALYWRMMDHLTAVSPEFARGKVRRGFLRRFHKAIYAMDSTTIQLVMNNLDWARHRRRKAAAKCHMRLNLESYLPGCVIIDTAKHHDNTQARVLCGVLRSGEIVVFDKAYVDFGHLKDLDDRGVFWVSRAKDNLRYRRVRKLHTTTQRRVIEDELIVLETPASRTAYPGVLRRVLALVEIDGKDVEMEYLTNNLEWSAWTVCELYRCRWDIEVFFKEIKATLQLSDFLGHNANAVRWQIWMGLLVHLLLRYLAWLHHWSHSFTRLFTVLRAVLWRRWHLGELLGRYGTAGPPGRLCGTPEHAYLPGFG